MTNFFFLQILPNHPNDAEMMPKKNFHDDDDSFCSVPSSIADSTSTRLTKISFKGNALDMNCHPLKLVEFFVNELKTKLKSSEGIRCERKFSTRKSSIQFSSFSFHQLHQIAAKSPSSSRNSIMRLNKQLQRSKIPIGWNNSQTIMSIALELIDFFPCSSPWLLWLWAMQLRASPLKCTRLNDDVRSKDKQEATTSKDSQTDLASNEVTKWQQFHDKYLEQQLTLDEKLKWVNRWAELESFFMSIFAPNCRKFEEIFASEAGKKNDQIVRLESELSQLQVRSKWKMENFPQLVSSNTICNHFTNRTNWMISPDPVRTRWCDVSTLRLRKWRMKWNSSLERLSKLESVSVSELKIDREKFPSYIIRIHNSMPTVRVDSWNEFSIDFWDSYSAHVSPLSLPRGTNNHHLIDNVQKKLEQTNKKLCEVKRKCTKAAKHCLKMQMESVSRLWRGRVRLIVI